MGFNSSQKTLLKDSKANSRSNLRLQNDKSVKRFNSSTNSLQINTVNLNENAKALKEIDKAARDMAGEKLSRNNTISIPQSSSSFTPLGETAEETALPEIQRTNLMGKRHAIELSTVQRGNFSSSLTNNVTLIKK